MSAKTYGFTGTLFLQLYLYNYIPSWLFLQGFWYLIQFVIFSFRRMRKTILWQRTIFIENIFFQSLTHLSKQHGSLSLIQNSISSFSLLSKIDFFFFPTNECLLFCTFCITELLYSNIYHTQGAMFLWMNGLLSLDYLYSVDRLLTNWQQNSTEFWAIFAYIWHYLQR